MGACRLLCNPRQLAIITACSCLNKCLCGWLAITTEGRGLRIEDRPGRFLDGLRRSGVYLGAYKAFFAGKNLPEDVSEEEKRVAFENAHPARVALVEYDRNEVRLEYQPAHYSEAARQAIDDYVEIVRAQKSAEPAEAVRLDAERTLKHVALAKQLVSDGLAPNVMLGRTLGRLILIRLGLDTHESAKVPDLERAKRSAG